MLDANSTPTIRFALTRRLDGEAGFKLADIKIARHLKETPPFLAVGVIGLLDAALVVRSLFHLPVPFEHRHLVNEIDEICEQLKAARKQHFGRGGAPLPRSEVQLAGNGLRGNWGKYG